jgi:hypothetical protein
MKKFLAVWMSLLLLFYTLIAFLCWNISISAVAFRLITIGSFFVVIWIWLEATIETS